jgi:8-oxo-dGTP pyrophosphatase MutT (NUDIX family)
MPKKRILTSYGMIVCRKNAQSGCIEAALIQRRYTYAFADFIHGKYKPHSRVVLSMLNAMTNQEILDILSLNFEMMWFRIWLKSERGEFFIRKQAVFNRNFLRDGGVMLKRLIAQTRAEGFLRWEAPKGKKRSPAESDLDCAIRECQEETRIRRNEYVLIPDFRRLASIDVGNYQYRQVYYVALARPHLANSPDHGRNRRLAVGFNDHQSDEVADVRWIGIEALRAIGDEHQLEVLAPVFRAVKKQIKKR